MNPSGELLAYFEQYFRVQMAALRTAAASNAFDEVQRIAHNLRGSAAQFGLMSLSEGAHDLERAANSKDAARVAAAVARLDAPP